MDMSNFVTIGENIHCTLIVKLGGIHTTDMGGGLTGVTFQYSGEDHIMPIPPEWSDFSPAMEQEKVKHMALAIWLATTADGEDQQAGKNYLLAAAQAQIDNDATFLDVNVDEYSNDKTLCRETMKWLATFLGEQVDIPLSIDSSDRQTLEIGLSCTRPEKGAPMINSVSLEREDCIDLIQQYNAHAVVSAAGKDELPCTLEGRIENFKAMIDLLDDAGIERDRMHLDPLVFPVSTDPQNASRFFEAIRSVKDAFGEVKLTGGYSNVSFGMPNRKLLNKVFTYLCVQHGAESGIINPVAMPPREIARMDEQDESFQLARAVLTGEDMYGMEYISAHREGRLK